MCLDLKFIIEFRLISFPFARTQTQRSRRQEMMKMYFRKCVLTGNQQWSSGYDKYRLNNWWSEWKIWNLDWLNYYRVEKLPINFNSTASSRKIFPELFHVVRTNKKQFELESFMIMCGKAETWRRTNKKCMKIIENVVACGSWKIIGINNSEWNSCESLMTRTRWILNF